MARYRDSTLILLHVLEALTQLRLMSEIERASRLSFDSAAKIVNELIKKKFVVVIENETKKRYQLSTEGLEFLKYLRIWCE